MAGVQALIVTVEGNPFMDDRDNYRIILDWTSAAAGTVSIAIASTFAAAQKAIGYALAQPSKIQGYLKSVETLPGLLGVAATDPPTASYDITLLDPYSYDVCGGDLADRSATAAEKIVPTSDIRLDSEITLTIASAGDDNHGRIIMEMGKG